MATKPIDQQKMEQFVQRVLGDTSALTTAPTLLLFLLGCGLALAIGEGMVRLFDPQIRDYVIPSRLFVIDAPLGWRLRPDTTVVHRTEYFTVSYTINASGYRDRSRPVRKSADRTRILLYGDSQVFGWGVPDSLRFSNLLEARHPELELWNLAVPAYGLDQQLIAYEERGREMEADVVAFFVSPSTLRRIEKGYLYAKYKPRFVVDRAGVLQLVPIPRIGTQWTIVRGYLFSHWYLPYFLYRQLPALIEKLKGAPNDRQTSRDDPVNALADALLVRAAEMARARGHRLMLLTTLCGSASETLRRMTEEYGIRVIALELPTDTEGFVFGSRDRHWTPRAHDRIAHEIWQQWSAEGDPAAVRDRPRTCTAGGPRNE